jgi:L-asparaginase
MGYRVPLFAVALAVAAPAAGQSPAAAADPPRVHFVGTGGTISNQSGGRLTVDELVELVPDLAEHARVTSEQFANVSSSRMTLDQWLQLSRRVNEILAQDPELAGVVVTSGTDTLEETAFFLHLTVRSERPVVVVGAMRNPSRLGYEGAANLRQAFRVAAAPQSRGKGVLVVLNDEINSAREVTKTDARRLHTFQSRGYGVLGGVDRDGPIYYRGLLRRHTYRSEFDLAGVTALPRVDVIMVYQGASGDLIEAAVDAGARAIVIASAGAGAASPGQSEGQRYAYERGVYVVVSTRTGSGRITPTFVPLPDEELSEFMRLLVGYRIGAQDLTPLKARILMMLALTETDDVAEIRRMFAEY